MPHRTLRSQKFDKWLVLLNGECTIDDLPIEVRNDTRIVLAETSQQGVGALKKEACTRLLDEGATVLVELDHDDELTPNALQKIEEVAEEDNFVYSDTASRSKYGSQWGWSCRSEAINGHRYWVHDTPDVCARSLYEIFYAPNHVRAWGRKAYEEAGGYDEELTVCDDHDLLCRTYTAGVEMRHIAEPLYVQTVHEEQTQTTKNAEIQKQQAKVGAKYLYSLVEEECRRSGLLAVDLGGRPGEVPGYQAINRTHPADILVDVTEGLPLEDGSVGVFRAHDFLEHIPIGQVVPFMNEIYRCLKPGGWLLSKTPSTDGRGAFQDPTHVSFWNSNSFWYYTKDELAKFVPEIQCRFQQARLVNEYPSTWHAFHKILYVESALWALKGQRQIGQIEI